MYRNEAWNGTGLHTLSVHLAWASLEVLADSVEDIQLLVSGDDMDVTDLKAEVKDGALIIEQPAYGLTHRINLVRWMQVCLRVPAAWKGAVDLSTIAGQMNARGLKGTDISITTASGDIRVSSIEGLTLGIRSVTGCIAGGMLSADQAALRSVSGSITLGDCAFRTVKVSGVSGDVSIDLTRSPESADLNTVTAPVRLTIPSDHAVLTHRTATGKLQTEGVSIGGEGPAISVTTVSGSLYVGLRQEGAGE